MNAITPAAANAVIFLIGFLRSFVLRCLSFTDHCFLFSLRTISPTVIAAAAVNTIIFLILLSPFLSDAAFFVLVDVPLTYLSEFLSRKKYTYYKYAHCKNHKFSHIGLPFSLPVFLYFLYGLSCCFVSFVLRVLGVLSVVVHLEFTTHALICQ